MMLYSATGESLVCMDGWMDVWMYVCMYVWMDGWMYGWMDVWMYVCMDVWPPNIHTYIHTDISRTMVKTICFQKTTVNTVRFEMYVCMYVCTLQTYIQTYIQTKTMVKTGRLGKYIPKTKTIHNFDFSTP